MTILYINCKLYPFIQWIIDGKKLYETRNKNTLQSLIGKTVYIAETGKGKAIVRCRCRISDMVTVYSKKAYNEYRKYTRIVKGSVYDWSKKTVKKCLYKLSEVEQIEPFQISDNVIRHGRIYCETI